MLDFPVFLLSWYLVHIHVSNLKCHLNCKLHQILWTTVRKQYEELFYRGNKVKHDFFTMFSPQFKLLLGICITHSTYFQWQKINWNSGEKLNNQQNLFVLRCSFVFLKLFIQVSIFLSINHSLYVCCLA